MIRKPPELMLFVVVAAIAVGLLAWLGPVLWTRPLWTDEWCTVFVASHARFGDAMRSLAAGGDWVPPILPAVLWFMQRAGGELTPVVLRTLSLVTVLGALAFVYGTLRRRVTASAAAAGTLAVGGHALVLAHAFEIRPYGPWLLFAAACAWALDLDASLVRSRRRDVWIGVFSVLLCAVHWFGVLSLGLIALGAVVASRHDRWYGLRRPVAMLAGVAAFVALQPLLASQRASAEDLLWVRPVSASQLEAMAGAFWITLVPVAAMAVLLVARVASAGRRGEAHAGMSASFAGLTALLAMPLVLLVLSVTVQPTLVDRYAIVAALGWAPLVAVAVEAVPGWLRTAFVAGLSLVVVDTAGRVVAQKRAFARATHDSQVAFADARRLGLPVVFQRLHLAYAVAAADRGPASPARFLEVPDAAIDSLYASPRFAWLRREFRVERNQARLHSAVHGFPALVTQARLDTTPRFLLLATDLQLPTAAQPERWGSIVFPHHRVTRLRPSLTLFERRDRPAPAAASQVQ